MMPDFSFITIKSPNGNSTQSMALTYILIGLLLIAGIAIGVLVGKYVL